MGESFLQQEQSVIIVDPDPFINSPNVAYLHPYNFMEFLKTKDAVLVYFYKPVDPENEFLKAEFAAASCSTKRSNHAFAAVNCFREKDLCAANKVTRTPRLNLYSRGFYVAHAQNAASLKEPAIRQFVETSPLLTQPKGQVEQL